MGLAGAMGPWPTHDPFVSIETLQNEKKLSKSVYELTYLAHLILSYSQNPSSVTDPEVIYPTICTAQSILWYLNVMLSQCLTEFAYPSSSANVSLDQKTGSGTHEKTRGK